MSLKFIKEVDYYYSEGKIKLTPKGILKARRLRLTGSRVGLFFDVGKTEYQIWKEFFVDRYED